MRKISLGSKIRGHPLTTHVSTVLLLFYNKCGSDLVNTMRTTVDDVRYFRHSTFTWRATIVRFLTFGAAPPT